MNEVHRSELDGVRGVGLIAAAIGAVAIGAFAIGRLAIRRVAIGKATIKSLQIAELDVKRLRAGEVIVSSSLTLPGPAGDRRISP